LIGSFVSIRFLYRVWKVIWIYFLRPAKSFSKHKGNWAVITGSSWGIGYGFVHGVAKRGMNVVLIARSEDRLKEIATEIEGRYKVKTKSIVIDFGSNDPSIYQKISEEIQGLNITMLINNVGINTQWPKFFHETSIEEMNNMVQINIKSGNMMTSMILPQMRERKFGTIINVSSGSAYPNQPTPLFSVYSGTKAYNQKFSMSLAEELKK